ncbi:serine/threonine protein kinase [Desulfosoma caldarium]|uniref:Serine/threonine protein kinase n=1 Tax=Desulfosoma caldarium TaxID=610254 RepID=A0A3N1VM10_9BACT|nr:serine/threonine-protein kinase [Desulfosoma caldarium]ROR02980.1 serine/threonine protein kinase [Desulfosoma caldarium]
MVLRSGTVLIVGCREDEFGLLKDMIVQADPTLLVQHLGGANEQAVRGSPDLRLVIVRVGRRDSRPDVEVQKLRNLLGRSVPLMVLVPQGRGQRVRDILRAGADDYWILPVDESALPIRLQVLLEWGHRIRETMRTTSPGHDGVWHRFVTRLRAAWHRLVGRGRAAEEWQQKESVDTARFLDRWEKIRRLGFGSFGEVWLLREKSGHHLAVAKIPHEEKLNRKFLVEAAILGRLKDHPNAVKLLDVVKSGGKVVLIQEYVSGKSLQELLDEGLDALRKEKYYLQLLDVVAYAHRHHIMHRDIKPDNIVITPEGVLKLLDFGTAKDVMRRSISSTVIGSRPYMAPEQIMGRSRLASDVWALGVILYALTTEFLPFYSENEKELMDLILESPPQPLRELVSEVPEALEHIIGRCLEKDWKNRYHNAGVLQQALLEAFPEFGSGHILP